MTSVKLWRSVCGTDFVPKHIKLVVQLNHTRVRIVNSSSSSDAYLDFRAALNALALFELVPQAHCMCMLNVPMEKWQQGSFTLYSCAARIARHDDFIIDMGANMFGMLSLQLLDKLSALGFAIILNCFEQIFCSTVIMAILPSPVFYRARKNGLQNIVKKDPDRAKQGS